MDEKKSIKVGLGTVISIFIIILLVVTLILVYYLGFVKNNQEILRLKDEVNVLKENNNTISNEKESSEKSKDVTNNIIMENNNKTNELISKVDDATISGPGFIEAFKLLGLTKSTASLDDYEIITYYGQEYYKTDVKYSDFKSRMLEYKSEENFENYNYMGSITVKDGLILLNISGTGGVDSKLIKFELVSHDNNNYIFNTTEEVRSEGPGYDIDTYKAYFIKENNKFLLNKIELLNRQEVLNDE